MRSLFFAVGLLALFAGQSAFGQQHIDYPTVPINKAWWWDDAWWKDGVLDRPDSFEVIEKNVSYMSGDIEVPAILYRPKRPGAYPAVLFQHGRAGLIDWVRGHPRRLAARGFTVLAPDVFSGRFIDSRPIEHDYALEDDVNAGLSYLLGLPDVASTRACLYSHTRGGYYTLKVAVTKGRQTDAAACYVSYYPHMQDPNAPEAMQVYRYARELDDLIIPAMIFIGENDQYQRRRSMETGVNAMLAKGRDVQLFVYPGVGRGFDFRPEAVRTFADDLASKDSIHRAELFMRKNLKPFSK
ncbi:MAG: dienelactone hydrolase [Rhodospirillaceae bacterium]|jgi:carboxymethylenebutenolidase|nr:dienelactone hydrolase [Rhodospirillaceae bacterium]MBT4220289.1 dienelactone hydrolase [Rhodospirillaceae bacterium]MBT4464694.1 dienelactone hydrolase [Rhodospirillaceae bacterium]MBT5309659.1 dienelactone hydrolase [Rhodospirillaceae bacterium]MBT6407740.1 dienelactone hydrolase [Rhodospirillaceae bacterium]